MKRTITLTTDFGQKDPYQGAMKGVILSINPEATIVDITHQVAPGDIVEGAFILQGAYRYFPKGTVHVAVVDPGVGSSRKPLLIETDDYFFIGPDNGLLTLAVGQEKIKKTVHLTNTAFFRTEVSNTFHGRDIFVPVAAHLSMGVKPEVFGADLDGPMTIDIPEARKNDGSIRGEVIYIDSFGNLITNIRDRDLNDIAQYYEAGGFEVEIKGRSIKGLKKTYSSAGKGTPVALISSSRYLEIAVNSGAASKFLGASVGEKVTVRLHKKGAGH